jgi:hypothetical protein
LNEQIFTNKGVPVAGVMTTGSDTKLRFETGLCSGMQCEICGCSTEMFSYNEHVINFLLKYFFIIDYNTVIKCFR